MKTDNYEEVTITKSYFDDKQKLQDLLSRKNLKLVATRDHPEIDFCLIMTVLKGGK